MKPSFQLATEQWVLFGAFIFLGVIALIKAFTLPDINSELGGSKKKAPENYAIEKVEALSDRWNQPPVLKTTNHKVYVSRLVVYKPTEQIIEALSDEGRIREMTVSWLKKYELSLEDPNVAVNDPDQDGFSNIEEFKGNTNPKDSESHPDLITKLCMEKYEFVPFKMEFKGYNPSPDGDGLLYQIKLPEVRGRKTRLVKEGADLEGYMIGEFRKKIVERFNPNTKITEKIDESELDVIHPVLKTPVTLIFNKIIESDESNVTLRLNVPNLQPTPSALKRGEIFKVKDVSYQYIKANAQSAIIKQVDSNQEFTIASCSQ